MFTTISVPGKELTSPILLLVFPRLDGSIEYLDSRRQIRSSTSGT